MQRLCGTVRTISFVFGVLLICIATLDAAPSPRIDENDSVIFSNNIDSYTSPVVICTNLFHYLQKSGLLQFSNIGKCLNLLKFIPPHFYSEIAEEGPQQQLEILEMLARLGQNMIRDDLENSKRGLGFGMDRGFSGQQAAKHLMGLHAATWAGGPGRRRRSETEEGKRGFDFGLGRGHSAEQATRHRLGYEMANLVGKREPSEADE